MSDESDRVADLSALIDEKNARIAALEAELDEARRLNRLVEEFVAAASEHLDDESTVDPPDAPAWPDWTRVGAGEASGDSTATGDSRAGDASEAGPAFDPDSGDDGLLPEAGSSDAEGRNDSDTDAADGSGDTLTDALAGLDAVESPDPRNSDLAALHDRIDALSDRAVAMLVHYHREGPATPVAAFEAGGVGGDRTAAYAANRELRTHEFVEHVGQGTYDTRFEDLVVDRIGGDPATIEDCRAELLDRVERAAAGVGAGAVTLDATE
ncbi:hypothetical protein [Halococcoides cellulosivorans]|uniref:Winged helix domain-containing protein n=1 Tax=Halococcoides cellulosivorans TaxID=1679096 RepID=A0A2R4X235_9EURY|nr:hypothetical protein [Halococcoides cellulosivorans]AWB27851.1 hypothetical protein HARCEL1_09065 [Halococcoides cellulosivorans]